MSIWANLPIPLVELYLVKVPVYFSMPSPALFYVCIRRSFCFPWTELYKIMSMYFFSLPIHGP
jgi:hypothetical protein